MTEQINRPTESSKLRFIQLIIPILLAVMVFLLGIIAWVGKTSYADAKEERKQQQLINLQILDRLGNLNSDCDANTSDVNFLKDNDRRQDRLLEQHEIKLNLINK